MSRLPVQHRWYSTTTRLPAFTTVYNLEGKSIEVFNHDNHTLDFTRADEIVEGVGELMKEVHRPATRVEDDVARFLALYGEFLGA
jgi:hypothetical protein